MNEQLLIELKHYLQIHSEDLNIEEKISECDSLVYKDEAQSQVKRSKPVKRSGIKHQLQQVKLYEEVSTQLNISPRNASFTRPSETDIEEYLRKTKNEDTFSTMLLKYIDQTGEADSEIYKRAGLDRKHFSKIRCDKDYRPKKTTAIALCLALKLRLDQVEEMLKLAGYSLSNSETGDLIVKFCIEKGMYELMDVNYALEYFGVKTLGVVG